MRYRHYWVLVAALLLAGCGGVPYKANQLPSDIALRDQASIPSNSTLAVYMPEYFLNTSYTHPSTQEFFALGASMGRAINDVNAVFFPDSFMSANNLHKDFELLLDIDPDWDVEGTNLILTLDYQVLDAQQNVVHSSKQEFSERLNFAKLETSFYNASVRTAQMMFVDVANSLQPSKSNFPEVAKLSTVPLEKLVDLETPIRRTTGFKLNEFGEVLTTSLATEGCLVAKASNNDELYDVAAVDGNSLLDISVLSTGATFDDTVSFARTTPVKLGEHTYNVSFNRSGDKSDAPLLSFGNIQSAEGIVASQGTFQVSSPVRPGSSGSAVLDDSGNFIGFVNGSAPLDYLAKNEYIAENVFFALKAGYVKKFLDSYDIVYSDKPLQEQREPMETALTQTIQINCYQ